jgi:ABC-type transport system substrate-binding protein
MDSTRHISTLNSGRDFDLSFFVFNPLTIDPDWSIWFNYHTEGASAYQRFGFTNKTIDQLIMKARSEPDPEVRRNIYILIQSEVDSVPMQRIYIFRPYTTVVANKWVIGDLTPVIRIGYAIDFTKVDIDIGMKPRG